MRTVGDDHPLLHDDHAIGADPAAYCSLAGFKPSADTGAFDPPRAANTVVGPLTWSVADAHARTEASSGLTIAMPTLDAADLRATVVTTFGDGWPATDAVLASVDTVAAALDAHGASATRLDRPVWPHNMFDRAKRFGFAGFRSMIWPLLADRHAECSPTLASHLLACATITDDQADDSSQHALDDLAVLSALVESCDVLITPTRPTTAHRYPHDAAFPDDAELDEYGYTFDHNPFTFPFNHLGAPAITHPSRPEPHRARTDHSTRSVHERTRPPPRRAAHRTNVNALTDTTPTLDSPSRRRSRTERNPGRPPFSSTVTARGNAYSELASGGDGGQPAVGRQVHAVHPHSTVHQRRHVCIAQTMTASFDRLYARAPPAA